MGINHIIEILNQNYNLHIKNIELFREGGNLAYVVYGEDNKFYNAPHCQDSFLAFLS